MSDDQTPVVNPVHTPASPQLAAKGAEDTLSERVDGFISVMKDLMAHNHVQLVFTGPSSLISEVRVDEPGMELLSSFVEVKPVDLEAKKKDNRTVAPIVSDYKYEVTMGPLNNPNSIKGLLGGNTTYFMKLVEPANVWSHELAEMAQERAEIASWKEKFLAESAAKISPSAPAR